MLYRVTLYTPDPYAAACNAAGSWIVGTPRAAELTSLEVLGETTESEYGFKVNRRPFCTVQSVVRFRNGIMPHKEYRETDRYKRTIDQPVEIVSSVGDLGYW